MNKTALVTGASMGIGLEFAKIMAARGWDLVLVARSGDKLNQIKLDIETKSKVKVDVIVADLIQKDSAEFVYNEFAKLNKPCIMLINNAGFGHYGKFHEEPLDKFESMIDLNITTLTKLTHLFLKDMVRHNEGYILNVASTAAFQPGPLMAVYYATKSYVLSFTEAISNELSNTNVKVSALCPGPTESNFQKNADLDGSGLFKMLKAPTAYSVAEYGINSLLKGKTVAVHGLFNKLLVFSTRFSPRKAILAVVRRLQEKRV